MRLVPTVCSALALLALIVFFTTLPGCSKAEGKPAAGRSSAPVPVSVAPALQQDVPVQLREIGSVEAYNSVTIKPRVSGLISQVDVVQGQDVKPGDLLFVIDPRPFKAALAQAEAALQRDQALARNTQTMAKRQAELFEQKLISPSDYDQAKTNAEASAANVKADEATVQNAKLQLDYCTIRSPISGKAGSVLVNIGNNVKLDDTSLLVINQIQPIYVSFAVPQEELGRVLQFRSQGTLTVEATIPPDETTTEHGELTFIDNAVDTTTGTIRLRGTFANKDQRLWPGLFVHVVLTLTVQHNALVVPSRAVQTGQQGHYLFAINDDQTARNVPVKIDREIEGQTVVEGDLKPGEPVVTDGQLRLVPGARVQINKPATQPATAPTTSTSAAP